MKKFAEMEYKRPDLAAYAAELEAHVEKVKNAATWEELKQEWLRASERSSEVMTMQTIASIRSTIDTTDEFYDAEMRYFNAELPKLRILKARAEEALLASPFKADFEKEYGSILIKTMEMERRFADERIIPYQVKESDLTRRYSRASATAVTEFRGKQVNFYGLLKQMQSTDRATREEAFRAWSDLYAKIAPELDAIYDEMTQVRTEMAKVLGFDSYTDMAYLLRRRFDYKAENVKVFRDQVKRVVTPACARFFEEQRKRLGVEKLHWYDEALVYPDGNADPEGTKDELVAKALEMYKELSPETGEFFSFMVQYDMFDLETRPGKRPGGYCTRLPMYKAPFIFSNFNGTAADMEVLTHEAGHAFMGYVSSRVQPLPELSRSTSEINEIHSMAMEHFTYPWMEKFFGDKTEKYLYSHLWGALNVIPYMCCVDEFQHEVYARPDMTAMDRRAVWHRLEKEYMPWRDYDGNEFLEGGGFWMQKQHIFLFPFYYIEYALAQMCAFQFYLHMLDDREAAWAAYLKLCRAGGSLGYFDLLKLAGLDNPFEEGTVEKIIAGIVEKLEG